jgi:uncharacterized protein (TIGR02246 family)
MSESPLDRAQTAASTTASIPVEELTAVRAVFDAVTHAWADNDADAFVEWYSDAATAILPGYLLRGKAGVRASMAEAFAGPLKGSQRIHAVQSMRLLGDDTAIVISRSGTLFPGEAEPPADRWAFATWLLSRQDGRWLVEAYHDCPAS